jgi:hypothetical protein
VVAAPSDVTLFFSAEVRGYIGPCGCSENMRGGIARSAYQVEEARRAGKKVHFIDCGDGLFDTLSIPEAAIPQQERKAQALAAAWKKMGLEARTGGPLDDARGPAFRESLGLPELAAGSYEILDGVALIHAPTLSAAKVLVPDATKAGGRFFVAVVPAPADQLLRDAMDPSGIHLVIAAKSKDAFSAEESRLVGLGTKVAQVQSKGRSLLEVSVHFRGDGSPEWLAGDGDRARELASLDQRIELLRAQVNEPMLADALKALRKAKLEEIIARREALASAPIDVPADKSSVTARFVPLESNFPRDPAVAEIEKQYDVDVGLINLAWAEKHGVACPPATAEKPGFVGSEVCSACHPTAAAAWKSTKHVKAYEALVNVGKQHHLDCVSCHVLGWQQPQGVCRIDQTENRREVGCESCHGPGSLHLANPKAKGVMALPKDATVCVSCHDKENSPQFEFDSYVSKIVVPGHGLPVR